MNHNNNNNTSSSEEQTRIIRGEMRAILLGDVYFFLAIAYFLWLENCQRLLFSGSVFVSPFNFIAR